MTSEPTRHPTDPAPSPPAGSQPPVRDLARPLGPNDKTQLATRRVHARQQTMWLIIIAVLSVALGLVLFQLS